MKPALALVALLSCASAAAAGFVKQFQKRPDVEADARPLPADAGAPAEKQESLGLLFCRHLPDSPPRLRELAPPAQFATEQAEEAENQSRLDLQQNMDDLRRYLVAAQKCRETLSAAGETEALGRLDASIHEQETELLKQKHLERSYPPRVKT